MNPYLPVTLREKFAFQFLFRNQILKNEVMCGITDLFGEN